MKLGELTSASFLDELASGKPTPGGGGAAAYTGALATALISMVANLTVGKKDYKDVEDNIQDILVETEMHRLDLLKLVDKDAEVFSELMASFQLPKTTEKEKAKRTETIQAALKAAAAVPLEIARKCEVVIKLSSEIVGIGNKNAITDATISGILARAALRSALFNVKINLISIKDREFVDVFNQEMTFMEAKALDLENKIIKITEDRM